MLKLNHKLLSLCLLSTTLLPQAYASLSFVGPLNPANGFPKWYKDSRQVRLQLCLDRTPICALEEIDFGSRIVFPTNFPSESVYWAADARVRFGNPRAEVRAVFALEAAFANEIPKAGDRLVFGRVRLRGRGLPAGTYRITHPYGRETFEVEATTDRQINETADIGVEPEVFTGALQSGIGPFLVWDPAIAPLPPAGYVGDPDVPHRVIGSPRGTNFLRVERLSGGVFVTVAETDEFNVIGKHATDIEQPVLSVSPKGGRYRTPQRVTISSSIDSNVFYTLDGTNPLTSTTRVRYTGPFTLPECAALLFGALNGTARSDVTTEIYVKIP